MIEAIVSVKRLSNFLRAGELQPDARKVVHKADGLHEGDEVCHRSASISPPAFVDMCAQVLNIRDGEFNWSSEQIESTLHGIDLTVKKGELVGVLGRVGAGKVSKIASQTVSIE